MTNDMAKAAGLLVVTDERRLPPRPPLPETVTPAVIEELLERATERLLVSVVSNMNVLVRSQIDQQRERYAKPLLLMSEAAEILGVSTKRFMNIIQAEKTRLGRLPDFVCDAGGIIQRRIVKDRLLKWAERCKKSRVPPFRNRKGGTS